MPNLKTLRPFAIVYLILSLCLICNAQRGGQGSGGGFAVEYPTGTNDRPVILLLDFAEFNFGIGMGKRIPESITDTSGVQLSSNQIFDLLTSRLTQIDQNLGTLLNQKFGKLNFYNQSQDLNENPIVRLYFIDKDHFDSWDLGDIHQKALLPNYRITRIGFYEDSPSSLTTIKPTFDSLGEVSRMGYVLHEVIYNLARIVRNEPNSKIVRSTVAHLTFDLLFDWDRVSSSKFSLGVAMLRKLTEQPQSSGKFSHRIPFNESSELFISWIGLSNEKTGWKGCSGKPKFYVQLDACTEATRFRGEAESCKPLLKTDALEAKPGDRKKLSKQYKVSGAQILKQINALGGNHSGLKFSLRVSLVPKFELKSMISYCGNYWRENLAQEYIRLEDLDATKQSTAMLVTPGDLTNFKQITGANLEDWPDPEPSNGLDYFDIFHGYTGVSGQLLIQMK